VRDYQPTDSLRYVHWPITAHRGQLMVIELETEPSGAVWVVLDLDQGVHQGEGDLGTLEYSIIVAASLTAQLVNSSDQRAVGLFTISGGQRADGADTEGETDQTLEVITRQPQSGQAQLWSVLAALAPVQPSRTPLVELLRIARASLGRRSTIIVVTARPTALLAEGDWPAQLVHLQATGVSSTVCLVNTEAMSRDQDEPVRALLVRYTIPVQTFVTSAQLPAALTFRRTRTVIRSTPTGGVVTFEEEVEVG
jgi:uncharacterized protein (DUF58 family)